MADELQYDRKFELVVGNDSGAGLQLSDFRIKFAIKKTSGQTPNTGVFKVHNLNADTAKRIHEEFKSVMAQGGYQTNFGVLFSGNSKQVIFGVDDNNVDTYVEIQAADGDAAYNFSVVNATISAGASQRDQIEAAAKVMSAKGVAAGSVQVDDSQRLPRGKVMYGAARDYLRQSVSSSAASWTIQNGVLQVVPLTGVLPGEAVVLNSSTGLVGRPKQTSSGLEFRCLLNPFILIDGTIKINESDIQLASIEDGDSVEVPALNPDGLYRVIEMVLTGDTRGNDWYIEGVALSVDATVEPSKSVQRT